MKTNCSQNVGFHFPMSLRRCSPADARLKCMAIPQRSCTQMGRRRWPPWGEFNPPPTEGVQGVLDQGHIVLSQSSRLITKGQAPDGKLKFSVKLLDPSLFLSPGAWGPPPTLRQEAEICCFMAFFFDFLPFQVAIQILHRKNIEKNAKIEALATENAPKTKPKSCLF